MASAKFKRAHKKSRTGCTTCLQRRVKCDEGKPSCGACAARFLDCQYRGRPLDKGAPSVASVKSHHDTRLNRLVVHEHIPRIPEKDLAYHYLSHTSKTLAATGADACHNYRWQVLIPAQAVTSQAVRSGMLAVAACCGYFDTAPKDEGERTKLLHAAVWYYESCLSDVKQTVQHLENVAYTDSIISSTRLLFVLGLAFCRLERSMGTTLASPEGWAWLPLLRGVRSVYRVYRTTESPDSPGFSKWQAEIGQKTGVQPHESLEPFKTEDLASRSQHAQVLANSWVVNTRRLEEIIQSRESVVNAGHLRDCVDAIELLDAIVCYMRNNMQAQSLLRVVFLWPSNVQQGFAESLIDGDRLALTIYTQWLLLLELFEGHWLVGDMGRSGILEIAQCSLDWSADEQTVVAEAVWTLGEIMSNEDDIFKTDAANTQVAYRCRS